MVLATLGIYINFGAINKVKGLPMEVKVNSR
jgi:hypothetical protein